MTPIRAQVHWAKKMWVDVTAIPRGLHRPVTDRSSVPFSAYSEMDPPSPVEMMNVPVLGAYATWLQPVEMKHAGLVVGSGNRDGDGVALVLREGEAEGVLDAPGEEAGDCAGSLKRHDSLHTRTSPLGRTVLPRGRTLATWTVMGPSGSEKGIETMRSLR
jgi:hypothetical protein